jgi:signal transduction histidine kinase
LIAIVNDILDIERLESGQINIQLEVLELLPLLRLAIGQNEGYAERYRVRLRLALPMPADASIKVLVDQQRFLQIMANLISNAIKFSPPEHEVTVNVELAEHSVRIDVSDQGAGVPEEFRDRIFQKFAQADATDARQRGGTGLGLSITKVLVERMQGYINYHSVTGKGSTFYVIFPLQ